MTKDKKYRITELALGFAVGFSFLLFMNISYHKMESPLINTLIEAIFVFGGTFLTDRFLKARKKKKLNKK